MVRQYGKKTAACIVEPMMQGAAGMISMPPGYLKLVEKTIRKAGILFICDEVATGFGRTGTMFACEHEGIHPDIMCLAKGITGGYMPLAATVATEKIYRAFLGRYEEFRSFFHGHTYTAHPLGCAAAIANIELFRKEKTLARLAPKIVLLHRELKSIKKLPWVGDIRQLGMMVGIELVMDKRTRKDFPPAQKIGARVCAACRQKGIILRPLGNIIVLMPPLSITEDEIKTLIKTLSLCICETLSIIKENKKR